MFLGIYNTHYIHNTINTVMMNSTKAISSSFLFFIVLKFFNKLINCDRDRIRIRLRRYQLHHLTVLKKSPYICRRDCDMY